ncbi:uncharacterized protein PHALS_07352 [Plasmopara halstedii]|uniref:Uncharacterized protein n=1 Tax=Plasmopara halstedii TaxID=4781 RepID=A0A0P1B676_PLAHL|nr:uncharacterized protein PHALS_07352 [Plasmopara halstedii]CEG49596.1 hypothetical protein PHALS_07352 [Plasmopara halstedii]|eukprot:XP_024585965.1 hypothetical protein PHALS_07352 [Plasmopara halstedii]
MALALCFKGRDIARDFAALDASLTLCFVLSRISEIFFAEIEYKVGIRRCAVDVPSSTSNRVESFSSVLPEKLRIISTTFLEDQYLPTAASMCYRRYVWEINACGIENAFLERP